MNMEFKIGNNDNTLFTTARCNNNCIMCCQPPLDNNDIEELYQQNIAILKRAPKGIDVIGISGGEPTLLGEKLIELISVIRELHPSADIHLLSNGRLFNDIEYTREVVKAAEGHLMVGVPLHSDYYRDHDIIAGAKEAYNETVTGLFNLAAFGAIIELRIVINKLNYMRLPQMAEFINKNLPFVGWVALMGMEFIGNAEKNAKNIWIEPKEYACYLEQATLTLAQCNIDVAIYNIPLCLLPEPIHTFSKKSISKWKNIFIPLCEQCSQKSNCCGIFSTSKKQFEGLSPLIQSL